MESKQYRPAARCAAIIVGAATTASAIAGGVVSWNFDESTTGRDVFWTSPTSVQTDAAQYNTSFSIDLVEVDVEFLSITFTGIDVTDQIPPELTSGSEVIDGPPPITLFVGDIVFPQPPDTPAVTADLLLGIDEDGFGFLNATDVFLGTADIDLGGILGVQEVTIEAIRIAGSVTVDPIGVLSEPADLDGDGSVGPSDLAMLLGSWGPCTGCPADLDGDGSVGPADLAILLGSWG